MPDGDVTPLVASSVAVTVPDVILPALRKRSCTVTVSPTDKPPSAGVMLSAVSVAPADTILTNGNETVVDAEAELLAGAASVCDAVTVAVDE